MSTNRVGQRVALRWRALDRGRKLALAGMVLLTAGAIAVRAWLVVGYGDAFLGFRDSSVYVGAAKGFRSLFNIQKPAGYPIFLKVVHLVSHQLSVTIFVQHALGIATGVLLYKAVRRSGAPPWLGLLPAAVVYFGGTGLFLEHALLGDPLFAFVQAVGLYMAVRALSEPGLRWPLLAGVAIGASFWIRTVGVASAVLVPPLLLFAAPGNSRRRVLSAATAALAVGAVILAYFAAEASLTKHLGHERQAVGLYGQGANPRFSVHTLEHEPITYVKGVVHGLTFYIDPRPGESYMAYQLREALLDNGFGSFIGPGFARYYPHYEAYTARSGSIHSLVSYESHTRVQGALLVVLLVAAIGGAPLLRGRVRGAAVLFTLTAIFSATAAVAGASYDVRYAYPTFGPLAAGAALGAWGIATRLKREMQRRRA